MIGVNSTFDGYFADRVAGIGLRGEEAGRSLETSRLVLKELSDMRESLSGVNIDEELTKLISWQNGYAAIARFVTTFEQMLDTIINRMGV
jgi:flagellar hook-associated protein 1 FlgK